MTAACIAGYARTSFTFARKGVLAGVRSDELGAHAVRELLKRAGAKPGDIEDLVWGCACPIESTRKALARAKLKMSDIDIVEMNEALARERKLAAACSKFPKRSSMSTRARSHSAIPSARAAGALLTRYYNYSNTRTPAWRVQPGA